MKDKINTKNIIKFTIPTIFTMLFMSVYTMVDAIFVSNLVGESALSAINIVFPIIAIVLALGLMLATGGNAICAKKLGEGEKQEARQNFTLFTIVGAIIGMIVTVLIYLNIENVANILGAEKEVFFHSIDYLKYIAWCFPFFTIQLIFQSMYITVNKPQFAFLAMLLGGLSNIILDYIFMAHLNMGIEGAAIATGIGSLLPAIIGVIYFARKNKDIYFVKPVCDLKVLGKASLNGSSEMIGNIATAVTTFLFNMSMLRLVGNDGIAAITVILYSQIFLNAIFMGYAMGISPVISYNYGEKNKKNLRKIFVTSIKIILIFSLISTTLGFILAEPITNIFTDSSSNVYNLTIEGMKIFVFSFIFAGFNIFASAMFTAYSNGIVSGIISFLRTLVLISASLLILPQIIGITGVWIAVPIAEALTCIISIIFIIKYRKKYSYDK